LHTVEEEQTMRAEALQFIQAQVTTKPTIGIILGTGLGSLVNGMKIEASVDYDKIPHFPVSTVESHAGRLLFGTLGGKQVVCMQGRFHYYEGYTLRQIAFPIRILKGLGIESLVISNAAGGMNPNFECGDIMLVTDHINFFPGNPLIGPNDDDWGVRFPDMHELYDPEFRRIAHEVALDQKLRLQQGVYIGVTGPTLETGAEYRMFRRWGADAVGMSTVPEVITARHQGTKVLAFSIITDLGLADNMHPCSIEEVLKYAAAAEPHLRDLIAGCVENM